MTKPKRAKQPLPHRERIRKAYRARAKKGILARLRAGLNARYMIPGLACFAAGISASLFGAIHLAQDCLYLAGWIPAMGFLAPELQIQRLADGHIVRNQGGVMR